MTTPRPKKIIEPKPKPKATTPKPKTTPTPKPKPKATTPKPKVVVVQVEVDTPRKPTPTLTRKQSREELRKDGDLGCAWIIAFVLCVIAVIQIIIERISG